ncbi:MAG: ATPase domain-containing protein, partial [Candidatus Bathyarchaeota archaeon]
PQLKDFYNEYSLYMQAWNEIENAKFYHIREDYSKSKKYYENAGIIHKKLDNWSYLSSNYFAWAKMEQAEEYSRTENPRKAIDNFQDANEYFQKTEHKIKNNILKNLTTEETNSLTQILRDSNNRQRYCQARILMEKARLLERDGKYLDSSKSYEKAAQSISFIVEKIENEEEHKELKYIEILCQAWKKMTNAEATTSAELYFDAAELFEEAKDYCFTKKASLWALGNSNFCKGLAAGVKYQITLDLDEHNKAKSFIKSASTNYLSAGFRNASEYAKATQRLFDAYLYINKAETESNQEIRAKHYQIVETLLQITSDSFIKAKQPKKAAKVQDILINVREEKELAISLSQVMKAPNIASTTTSFVAPSPINEVSVGLEKFEHANIQANLVTTHKQVKIGESFCLSLEFVNAGREPALLMKVEDFIPPEFLIVKNPEIYRIDKTALNMKGKQLAPLKLVEVKLTLQSLKKGKYKLNPKVHYLDELGQNKILLLKTLEITIEEIVLENRIATGTAELDSLLFGGFPNEYSIVLAGSPSDEREYLVKNFLEAGIRKDEIIFHVSTEMHDLEDFLKDSNFSLFVCNPKPKNKIPNQSNVYRLRSKTDLTNLSISIAKAYRNIDKSKKKRICIENVSNILLDYEAKATCKWVSELIADLSSKGFTMLFVMDPTMHPSDQAKAVINLFDGEINITQTEDPLECKKSIIVKKLRNQEYIKNPICLT